MKKRNMLLLILLISTIFACNPKTKGPNAYQHNKDISSSNSIPSHTNRSEQNIYEQYIQQWSNKRGVTIDLNINEINTNNNLWIVEAQIVDKNSGVSRPMYVSNSMYPGAVKFNFLTENNIPIPLLVPIKEHNSDFLPNDPAVIYNNGINSTQVDISYEYILKQMFKQQDVSAYFNEKETSTKGKDLIIYIYKIDSTYEHYKNNVLNHIYHQHSFTANVKNIIELQRFPL